MHLSQFFDPHCFLDFSISSNLNFSDEGFCHPSTLTDIETLLAPCLLLLPHFWQWQWAFVGSSCPIANTFLVILALIICVMSHLAVHTECAVVCNPLALRLPLSNNCCFVFWLVQFFSTKKSRYYR
jgi:predicted permease